MGLGPFRVGLTDLLDVALVAVTIYGLLAWFKQTKAAFVAMGILVLAVVYTAARVLGMYLTVWLFQGFFAILLIAIVIIFQEELRHIFERIAVWSLGQAKATPAQQIEIIVRSLSDLARDRIGALVILRGRDPLDRHCEGGWDLNGDLSEALIKSIFDSHSLGHDGAVIIEGGRMTRFGCHLPLSKDFGKITNMGTRHTAALGLSERTDALCLAVSQEHGSISIARGGEIVPVTNLQTLEERVQDFLGELAPAEGRKGVSQFLSYNAREKAIAVALSLLLWVLLIGLPGARR